MLLNKARALTFASLALLLAPRAQADETRPFKAFFTGTFSVAQELVFSGEGQASHLGHSTINGTTVSIPDFADTTTCPAGYVVFNIAVDFTLVTAANGDSITLHNTGHDCINFQTGDIVGSGNYAIADGTGRFVGARGSGTWEVAASLGTSAFELAFRGTITY